MTRVKERELAIKLRKQGWSYGEILQKLKVSKGTLSLWLRDYPLNTEQIVRLKSKKSETIERYIRAMKEKREKRLETYFQEQREKIMPLNARDLYIAGIFLYWGEGNKVSRNTISINNTDPAVVKFALKWIVEALGFPKDKVRVFIHLYADMNIETELQYWSKMLEIPRTQFVKPYIKQSLRTSLTQKGHGHGTCGVRVDHTSTKERILMTIRAISESLV